MFMKASEKEPHLAALRNSSVNGNNCNSSQKIKDDFASTLQASGKDGKRQNLRLLQRKAIFRLISNHVNKPRENKNWLSLINWCSISICYPFASCLDCFLIEVLCDETTFDITWKRQFTNYGVKISSSISPGFRKVINTETLIILKLVYISIWKQGTFTNFSLVIRD